VLNEYHVAQLRFSIQYLQEEASPGKVLAIISWLTADGECPQPSECSTRGFQRLVKDWIHSYFKVIDTLMGRLFRHVLPD
jgi:hypothetical protein